ncbi:MAG: type II toxin-antitoxin system VapC family toxin [Candidatus Bipolaricaulota bacterium]|nr:type II toxin-antitoxin system VapC family toxin [Candidatus Bipolaricaulota bacterium]
MLDRYQEGRLRLCAPMLLADEILNGLYLAVRGKGGRAPRLTPQEASEVWRLFQSLHISLEETSHLANRIFELALTYHRPSTYDATYIALAEHLRTKLITADERLMKSVPEKWVLPLWEFEAS